MSEWIAVPREHLRGGRTAPYQIAGDDLTAVRAHCEARGATSVEVGFDGAADAGAFIDGLKRVLPFPWWCGSGWDSMLDATEEFADGWPLPVLLEWELDGGIVRVDAGEASLDLAVDGQGLGSLNWEIMSVNLCPGMDRRADVVRYETML